MEKIKQRIKDIPPKGVLVHAWDNKPDLDTEYRSLGFTNDECLVVTHVVSGIVSLFKNWKAIKN